MGRASSPASPDRGELGAAWAERHEAKEHRRVFAFRFATFAGLRFLFLALAGQRHCGLLASQVTSASPASKERCPGASAAGEPLTIRQAKAFRVAAMQLSTWFCSQSFN